MVMVVDVSEAKASLEQLIQDLKREGERRSLGVSVELGERYKRGKKLIALDMDSTLVDAEVIIELAKLAGVEKQVREVTKKAMEGRIDFKTALEERVKPLRGLPVEEVEKLADRLPIIPGAYELLSELKRAGYITVLITGSFDVVAERIARKLGFDYVFANELVVEDGKLTGEVRGQVLDPKSKLDLLKVVAEKEGISLIECTAVGDGANDLLIVKDVGLGIGFNPKKLLKKEADAIVNAKDLRVVPAFLGTGGIREDVVKRL